MYQKQNVTARFVFLQKCNFLKSSRLEPHCILFVLNIASLIVPLISAESLICGIENYLSVFPVEKFLLHFEEYIEECYETVYFL